MSERRQLRITGRVQGVGFRPFLWRLAQRHGLAGWVANDPTGVTVELTGATAAIERFLSDVTTAPPPLARIEQIVACSLPPLPTTDSSDASAGGQPPLFAIRGSRGGPPATTEVPLDVAPCRQCLAEMHDPHNRRGGYPFLNCTDCGPRATILTDLPYDRRHTTMAAFPMCEDCQREYDDPANRRFHAQPTACPICGPVVWYVSTHATSPPPVTRPQAGPMGPAAIAHTKAALRDGQIIALKAVGGFQLACDATNAAAVATLRRRKQRPRKPFAVMVADLTTAAQLVDIDPQAAELLQSGSRPIVLVPKQRLPVKFLAEEVAPESGFLGVMLPSSPLHELLWASPESTASPLPPLVVTSGNVAGEPLIADNGEATTRLAALADGFLLHDRPIQLACDDSVVRCVAGLPMPVRLARGHAPLALPLPEDGPCVLAVGSDLKASLCLARGRQAILSPHLGDHASPATLAAFTSTAEHLLKLSDARPERVVADLHPGLLSTAWAEAFATRHALPLVQVQHHEAHAAALLAEHGLTCKTDSPILVVCCDGTGYGRDGTSLGSEFLLLRAGTIRCVARLAHFPLPGGDAAIREPWRLAVGLLTASGIDPVSGWPQASAAVAPSQRAVVHQQVASRLRCPLSSSMGRLFDAVASLCGLCDQISFEAEAALRLETAASRGGRSTLRLPPYRFEPRQTAADMFQTISWQGLLRQLCDDLAHEVPVEEIARRFHEAVAELVVNVTLQVRHQLADTHPHLPPLQVGLTGGVFQNTLLCEQTLSRLGHVGIEPLLPTRLPANDAGLAVGQAVLGRHALLG